MPWKVVEIDVPEEEATLNWSPQERSSALYKVDELAKIVSDGGDCVFNTSTAVSAGAFCVSIANEIHIFDGEQSNFLATVSLESDVDVMAWSPDSQFLVIGDNSGTVHFFSFACGDVVFSTNLVNSSKENDNTVPVFCNCVFTNDDNDRVNIMLLSADGCMFTFKGLPLKDLSHALESKDLSMVNKIKKSIQLETFDVSDIHDGVHYLNAATLHGGSSFIVAGSGEAAVSIWSGNNISDSIDCDLLGEVGARKCQLSPDGKYLVVLDEQSKLSVWDAHTLVMLSVLRNGVKDFTITSSATTGEADVISSDGGQVVLLATSENDVAKLEMYQFPLFEKTYSMDVSYGCSLVESSSYHERVFYIEKNTCDVSNNNVASVVYKCLSESSPEHRLYNLVRKKKFHSALEFSRAFGLDTDFVYKTKSSTILAEISTKISESDESLDERAMTVDELINELQEDLQNVKSVEFCVDCCLKASPPKLEQVYRLLCFAKEKVGGLPDKEKASYNSVMMDLLYSLYRLDTFKMVFGDACFTVRRWRQFCTGDMLSQVIQFLSEGKMSDAAIIWRRHQNELEENITAENLKSILVTIRSDLPSSSVISWLKLYVVPFVICSPDNEEALYVLASWLEQRITSLELCEKENWPKNGLEMARLLFDIHSKCVQESNNYENNPAPLLVDQIYGLADIQVHKNGAKPNPVSNLSHLVEHITELEKLHTNYHCKIPLAEFTKESSLGIMFKMLDSVLAIELIPNVVNGQITQYGIQHGFQIDDVLLKYINVQVKQVSVSNLSNTLHEARLVEIAKCIKTRAVRLEAILQLMSWATVPWSDVVEEMVRKAMVEDPLNEKLKWSYSLMEIKKVLINYGLRGIEFSNDSHVKGVVEYILGTSNDTALADALQITKTYSFLSENEVYSTRLQNLCLKGLYDECIKSLKMVSKPQVTSIVKRFLTWVDVTLQDIPVDDDDSQARIAVMKGTISILEHLRDIDEINTDVYETLEDLKNVLTLQRDFSIFISISDYRVVETREELLLNYVKENNMTMSILTKKDDGGNNCYVVVSRLARLFGLSIVQLQSKVILHSFADPIVSTNALTSLKMWLSNTACELSPEEIIILCITIFQDHITPDIDTLTSINGNVAEVLHWLTCCALTYGNASSLGDYLELCKLSWLNTSFSAHCESGGLSLSTSVCEEDLLQSWNTSHWFKDNGFVLDARVALPLQHMLLTENILVQEDPQGHLEKLMLACQKLVDYLQENNLHEVALQYALHCLSHLIQFSTINAKTDQSVKQSSAENNSEVMSLNKMVIVGCSQVEDMLVNLSSKALQSNFVDHDLAFGYLCSIPEDTVIPKLKTDFAIGQCHSSSKVTTVFSVALYYATHFCQPTTVKAVEELYSVVLWHSRLTNHHIPCGSLLTGDKMEARKVLEVLLEKPGIDVQMIVGFCKAFRFDTEIDDVMHTYIRNTPSERFDYDAASVERFEANLLCAISYISDVAKLLSLLKQLLESLSPYDYGRISIVLSAIIKHSDDRNGIQFKRQLEVLNILKKYQRKVSPCEYEKQYQVSESSAGVKEQTKFFDKSKQGRLPLHPLIYGNPWKIIAQELDDTTMPKLLPLCRLLKLQEDQVYVTAVNNLVLSCSLAQQSGIHSTVSTSANVHLPGGQFEKAVKLLSSVRSAEVAVKTAISLLGKWPQSEEKVKAAKATVNLAFKWVSSSVGDDQQTAENVYKIAKENAQVITIENILISGGVTDESFFNLKHKPAKLLMHLYTVYGCSPEANRPNVHKMASEIACASNVNINKIHGHLLETWLHSTYPGSIRSPEYSTSDNKGNDRDNLKRVMYLLEDGSMQNKHAIFLLHFANKSGQSKISYQTRVRAVEVLFNVASHKVIADLANDTLDGIRNYMKSLFYLSELEHLHLPQTMESFQRCNKDGLVKGLWKNHKDNANAVLLIADICLDSKMCDPQVWSSILRQLLHLGLTKYLSRLLPLLTKFRNLWQTPNLMKIWGELTVQPIQKVVSPLSLEDRYLCERSMLLLQKCPIMVEVDILGVFQKLVELGLVSYALGCFSLLPHDRKPSCLGSLIIPDTVIDILDTIAEDEAVGRGFVSPSVLETLVFEHVIAFNLYEPFKGSDHLVKLIDYLIAEKKLHLIVVEMIKHGDVPFAVELANHYEMYGSPLKKRYFKKHDVPGLDVLLCFLDSAGFLDEALPYLPAFEVDNVQEERPMLEHNPDEADEQASTYDAAMFDVF